MTTSSATTDVSFHSPVPTSNCERLMGSEPSKVCVAPCCTTVTGTVTEVNDSLKDAPEKINQDANATWMLKVELGDSSELNSLLSAVDYEKFVSEETGH